MQIKMGKAVKQKDQAWHCLSAADICHVMIVSDGISCRGEEGEPELGSSKSVVSKVWSQDQHH